MISNEARRKFAEEVGGSITPQLVEAFDEAEGRKEGDPIQAVLEVALSILEERIDAISKSQG